LTKSNGIGKYHGNCNLSHPAWHSRFLWCGVWFCGLLSPHYFSTILMLSGKSDLFICIFYGLIGGSCFTYRGDCDTTVLRLSRPERIASGTAMHRTSFLCSKPSRCRAHDRDRLTYYGRWMQALHSHDLRLCIWSSS